MRPLTKNELALYSGLLGSTPAANEIWPGRVLCKTSAKAEERVEHRAYNTAQKCNQMALLSLVCCTNKEATAKRSGG